MKKSIFALAMGTFGLGMAEFSMMGMLPNIAKSLQITIPQAGHFISAYALGVAVGAPLLVLIARKYPLKSILLGLALLIFIGNLFFSFSSYYSLNVLSRFVSGLPHGAYFGVGSIVACEVASKGKTASAIAGMVSGMTFANLLGVPLGTLLCQLFSWRVSFCLIALFSLIIFFCIYKYIPAIPAMPDHGIKGQFKFLAKLNPWLILFATALGNGAIFCWYSYVNPIMTQSVGFSESSMTFIMMCSGLGMVLGNYIGGKFSDKYTPEQVGMTTQASIVILLLTIFICINYSIISLFLFFLTAAALFTLSAPQQLLLLENAKGGELLGGAMVQVAFNIGNAMGAYLGGLPIAKGYSYEYAALPGISLAFLGFLCFVIYCKKVRLSQSFEIV